MKMTQDLMELIGFRELQEDGIRTLSTDFGGTQITFDAWVNGEWSEEDSMCYNIDDEVLPEHIHLIQEMINQEQAVEYVRVEVSQLHKLIKDSIELHALKGCLPAAVILEEEDHLHGDELYERIANRLLSDVIEEA